MADPVLLEPFQNAYIQVLRIKWWSMSEIRTQGVILSDDSQAT